MAKDSGNINVKRAGKARSSSQKSNSKKITVNFGRGNITAYKSAELIGVRFKPTAKTLPKALKNAPEVHHLGGFKVYRVANNMTKLNSVLAAVRRSRNVSLGTHVYFLEGDDQTAIVPTGFITVNFDADAKIKDRKAILDSLHLVKYRKKGQVMERNKTIVKLTSKSPNPLKCCLALMEAKDANNENIVASVMPDYDSPMGAEHAFQLPKNDLYEYQWHLQNLGAVKGEPTGKIIKGSDMKVVDAWKRLGNKGSKNITIAVIDSSFDPDHPVYQGKVNSFVLYPGEDMAGYGRSGHGTACASLAAGSASGQGITGVAPNSPLILLQGSTTSWQGLEQAFDICLKRGADIISCSWGSISDANRLEEGHHRVLSEMINSRGRNGLGCPVLYSVGNENQELINHWGAHPDVIAVAGSTSADEHFKFSNRGLGISVCAPAGEWPIIAARAHFESSAHALFEDNITRGPQGEYRHFSGTSASCPMVAGVCALILSANPNLKATDVKRILETTADKIGDSKSYDSTGYSIRFGYGRVNADRAVAEALRLKDGSGTTISEKKLAAGSDGLYKFDVIPQSAKGWGVQVGVYAEYKNVLYYTNQMRRKFGKPTLVNITELNGKTVYRLMIGPFDTAQEAKNFQKETKAKNIKTLLKNLELFKNEI